MLAQTPWEQRCFIDWCEQNGRAKHATVISFFQLHILHPKICMYVYV